MSDFGAGRRERTISWSVLFGVSWVHPISGPFGEQIRSTSRGPCSFEHANRSFLSGHSSGDPCSSGRRVSLLGSLDDQKKDMGARMLLGAPGLTTRSKKLLGAPGPTTRNKKLLGAPGPTTRNKKLLGAPGIATGSKDATRVSWHRY